MVVICSMEILVKDGKISNESRNAIDALEKNDKLIIISKNGSITVNTDTLNFLIHVKCPIEVSEYANTNAMLLNIGMELAKASQLKVVMKPEDAGLLKELLKGNEKVSFGWGDGKSKKKSQTADLKVKAPEKKDAVVAKAPAKKESGKKETDGKEQAAGKQTAEKAASKKETSGSKAVKKETAEAKGQTKKETAKKETVKKESAKKEPVGTKESAQKESGQKEKNPEDVFFADVKKAVGGKYSRKDLEVMTAVINESSDADLGLEFLCKIKLPVLYAQDENFMEKMRKAYKELKG